MRLWCAALLLVLLAACSSLRFTYNHGDTLLYWWLDAYVDLDSEQKGWVKADIDHFFNWHRKTQLHDYASLLKTAQHQLASGITQKDLLDDFTLVKDRTELLLLKSLPELAELARSLKPEQLAQLEKKFDSNNKDYRKKFMSGDEAKRKKVRYKKTMEQLELWFGNFSSEQEDAIRKLSDARPLDNEIWLDERVRRQQRILGLLRKIQAEKPSKEATQAMLHTLVKELFDRMEMPERKGFFDTYVDSTSRFYLSVIQLTTPAQKANAQKRMQGWIEDLTALAN